MPKVGDNAIMVQFHGGPCDGEVARYAAPLPETMLRDMGRSLYRLSGPAAYTYDQEEK